MAEHLKRDAVLLVLMDRSAESYAKGVGLVENADPGLALGISTGWKPRNLHCWCSERLASPRLPYLPPLLQGWVLTEHSLTGTPGLRGLTASHTNVVPTNIKDGEHKRQMAQMKLPQDILLPGTLFSLLRQVLI